MNKILLTSVSAALILAASCSGDKSNEKDSKKEETPVVKIEQVNDREVNQIGNYTATVEPELINNISSSAPNRIRQILVDEGMRVSAGQKLVVMDDVNTSSYELQVDNAKANLRNVEVNYNRALELFKIGGGTKQQVDQMEIQLINAKNALASAERTLRNVRENTVLTSPISGEVTINNSDNRVLPGMFGRVQLSLGTARHVVVPDKSIVKQPGSGNHFVYVYNPDATVTYSLVQLGQRLGDSYELISGVEPGSSVVVSGQTRLSNGAKVKVAK